MDEFDAEPEWLPERDAWRVGIGERYFDIRSGPMTDFGQSYEILGQGRHKMVIGSSIIGHTTGTGDQRQTQLEFRTPLASLREGVRYAVQHDMSLWGAMARGSQGKGIRETIVGGALSYGPNDPIPAQQDFASRISIGATRGTYMGDVTAEIERRRYRSLKPGSQWAGTKWAQLDPFIVHRDDDQLTRLMKVPGARPDDPNYAWDDPQTKFSRWSTYSSVRGAPGKDIKGFNITHQRRQLATPYEQYRDMEYQYDEGRGRYFQRPGVPKIRPMRAGQVMQSQRPEYAQSGVIIPGETAPREGMFWNEAIGIFPFSPGQAVHYGDLMPKSAHSFRVAKDIPVGLPFKSFDEFETAEWKFDRSPKTRSIAAGNTVQIGSVTYIPEGSKERSKPFPITVSAGASDLQIEDTILNLPRAYDPDTGRTFGISGMEGSISTAQWMEENEVAMRRQGIQLARTGTDAFTLMIMGQQSVAGGVKGFATKISLRPNLDLPENYTGRTATVGGHEIRIDLHNPDVKSLPVRFMGALGGLVEENRAAAIGYYSQTLATKARKLMDQAGGTLDLAALAEGTGMDAETLSSNILNSLLSAGEADPNEKRRIARRFGVGLSDEAVWMGEWVNDATVMQQHEYMKEQFGDRTDEFMRLGMSGTGEREGKTFTYYKTRPVMMRTFNQFTPEWAGGATMNYEMMEAISNNFGDAAKFMGIAAGQTWDATGDVDPARSGIREMARTFAFNRGGEVLPGARVVDSERAGRMMAAIKQMPSDLVGEDRLARMAEILGDETLYFKSMGTHMFSPKTAEGIETRVFDESITGISPLYENAVLELLEAEELGDVTTGWANLNDKASSYYRLQGRMNRMFDPEGGGKLGKGVRAAVFGREVSGGQGGRYSNLKGLAPLEVYMGDDQIRRMLKDMGVKGDDQMKAALRQIEEHGYLPGFTLRQPVLSTKYGAPAIKILTTALAKKKGLNVPQAAIGRGEGDPLMNNVSAWLNETIYNLQAGDLDFDPNAIIPAVRWANGQFEFADDIDPKLYAALNRPDEEVIKDAERAIEAQFSEDAGKFNVLKETAMDYREQMEGLETEGFKAVKGMEVKEGLLDAARDVAIKNQINYAGMGGSYSIRRRLTAAAATMGTFKKEEIVSAMDRSTKIYQQYLDMTRDSLTRLGIMHNTIGISAKEGNSHRFYYRTNPMSEDWDGRDAPANTNYLRAGVVRALAEDYMSEERPLPAETVAFMLSSGSKDIGKLQEIIENNSGNSDQLTDAIGDYLADNQINLENTPVGLSLLSSAVSRTMRKTDKEGRPLRMLLANTGIKMLGLTKDDGTKPHANAWTLQELALQKGIMGARIGYEGLSAHGIPLPSEVRVMEELASHSDEFLRLSGQFQDFRAGQAAKISEGARRAWASARIDLAARPIQLNASSLAGAAMADPENIFGAGTQLGFDELDLVKTAVSWVDEDLKGVIQSSGNWGMEKGTDIEKAFMKTATGKSLGKAIGRGATMRVPVTTNEGRYTTLVGVPDVVGITDDGITITDVKFSSRSHEDLMSDKGYKTQLSVYSNQMAALASMDDNGDALRDVLAKWGITGKKASLAVEHARAGKIKGQLHVIPQYMEQDAKTGAMPKGMDKELLTKVTEDDILSGRIGSTALDMGDVWDIDIQDMVDRAARNTILGATNSLNYLQSLSLMGKVKHGGGVLSTQGDAGWIAGKVDLGLKILSGKGELEDPRLRKMWGDRFAAAKFGRLNVGYQAGGSNWMSDEEEIEAGPGGATMKVDDGDDNVEVQLDQGEVGYVQKKNSMQEKKKELNNDAERLKNAAGMGGDDEPPNNRGVTTDFTDDENPFGDDDSGANRSYRPNYAAAEERLMEAVQGINAMEEYGGTPTYLGRLKDALVKGTGMPSDSSLQALQERATAIGLSGDKTSVRNLRIALSPIARETKEFAKIHHAAVQANQTAYLAESNKQKGYVVEDYISGSSMAGQVGPKAAVMEGTLAQADVKMNELKAREIAQLEKLVESLEKNVGGMDGLKSEMSDLKKTWEDAASGAETDTEGRWQLRRQGKEAQVGRLGRSYLSAMKAAQTADAEGLTEQFAELAEDAKVKGERFYKARAELSFMDEQGPPSQDAGGILGKLRLRRVLGGFGMMYMQRLGELATGGLGYGMEERAAMSSTFGAQSAMLTGVGRTPSNQMQILANQMALAGTNNNPILGLQSLRATAPFGQDVFNAASAGLGIYAFGQQMSMWGGDSSMFGKIFSDSGYRVGLPGGMGFNLTAGRLMGAAAAGSLLLGGIQQGRDVVGIGSRMGSGNFSSAITDSLGVIFGEATRADAEMYAQSTRTIRNALEGGGLASFDDVMNNPVNRKYIGVLPARNRSVDTSTPEGRAWMQMETQRQLASLNPMFSPEVISSTYGFMSTHGIAPDQFRSVATQFNAGYTENVASAILSAGGMSMSRQFQAGQGGMTALGSAYMDLMGNVTQARLPILQAGLGTAQAMGYAYQNNIRGMDVNQQADYLEQLAGIQSGTLGGDLTIASEQQAFRGQQLGYNQQARTYANNILPSYGYNAQIAQATRNKAYDTEDNINVMLSNMGYTPDERRQFTQKYKYYGNEEDRMLAMQKDLNNLGQVGQLEQMAVDYFGMTPGSARNYAQQFVGQDFFTVNQEQQMRSQQIGITAGGMSMGMSSGSAQALAQSAFNSGPLGLMATQGLVNFNPTNVAQFAQGGISSLNNIATRQIRQTYDANGNALGMASLPMFTMDMGIGSMTPQMGADAVFGAGWEGGDTYGLRSAAMTGGFRGMQTAYTAQAAALSGASAGIAMRGAELSYAFQTGIGLQGYGTVNPVTGQAFNLPSGGFWGMQDRQRDLSNRQQMWNFQYQEQSMDMQRSQFYENQALNRRGSLMQRGFTRRGWEFQDQVTDLQWGWQLEDFAEESRFMTGRSRKKAERQMDRATIMHELQTNRTDELRSQQEELWDLEDERFKMTREHFEEQMELQEENFEKMQEFYEERKKLEDQMQELQRAYFIEQNKLQKESAGIQAAMAALQRDMAENQKKMNEYLEDQAARQEYVKSTGMGVADMWEEIVVGLKDAAKEIADILDISIGNLDPEDSPYLDPDAPAGPSAWGTQGYKTVPGLPGQPVMIELHGGEMYDVKRRDEISNPWNDEVIPGRNNTRGGGSMISQTVIVKIGEHEIRDYIVETVEMEM